MARLASMAKILSGGKIPGIKAPRTPNDKISMGSVPDQAPPMNKMKALLAGVPMSVRGRKPRLGQL